MLGSVLDQRFKDEQVIASEHQNWPMKLVDEESS